MSRGGILRNHSHRHHLVISLNTLSIGNVRSCTGFLSGTSREFSCTKLLHWRLIGVVFSVSGYSPASALSPVAVKKGKKRWSKVLLSEMEPRRNLEKFAKKGGTPPAKGGAPPAKEGETPAKEAEPPAKKAD